MSSSEKPLSDEVNDRMGDDEIRSLVDAIRRSWAAWRLPSEVDRDDFVQEVLLRYLGTRCGTAADIGTADRIRLVTAIGRRVRSEWIRSRSRLREIADTEAVECVGAEASDEAGGDVQQHVRRWLANHMTDRQVNLCLAVWLGEESWPACGVGLGLSLEEVEACRRKFRRMLSAEWVVRALESLLRPGLLLSLSLSLSPD